MFSLERTSVGIFSCGRMVNVTHISQVGRWSVLHHQIYWYSEGMDASHRWSHSSSARIVVLPSCWSWQLDWRNDWRHGKAIWTSWLWSRALQPSQATESRSEILINSNNNWESVLLKCNKSFKRCSSLLTHNIVLCRSHLAQKSIFFVACWTTPFQIFSIVCTNKFIFIMSF